MRTNKKIPSEPRFGYVTRIAYGFLLECGYDSFPISPKDVLNELSDYVLCMSWSEAKTILKIEDPLHLKELNADGRVLRVENQGRYIIVYDDTINDDHHNSWTIIHEIGHILLGHLTDFEIQELNRGGLTKQEYETLEKEAHYFAAELLMPTVVMRNYSFSIEQIALLFNVSRKAAKKKHKRVYEASYYPEKYTSLDDDVIRNFSKFLITNMDGTIYSGIYDDHGLPRGTEYTIACRKCKSCYSYIIDEHAVFCPFCGNQIGFDNKSQDLRTRNIKRRKLIIKPGVNHIRFFCVDNVLRTNASVQKAIICPVCLNHQISENAEHCQICGNALMNRCLEDGVLSDYSGNFCPTCGREATSKDWYTCFETEYKRYLNYSRFVPSELSEYPYWEYIKRHPRLLDAESLNLQSSLIYTSSFVDDNDDMYIFANSVRCVEVISENIELLQELLEETDGILDRKIEVRLDYDL